MQILYHGLGSFTLSGKPGQGEVSLITNPFTQAGSLKFPRSASASLVVLSHEGKDTDNVESVVSEEDHDLKKKPFVVSYPGEYEVKGIFATGIDAPKKDGSAHTIYRFDVEGIHIGFLGALDRPLNEKEIEALGAVDILIIPAGGKDVLTASAAAELIAEIEPRLVIPSHIESGDGLYASAEALKKELGCPTEESNKFKVLKSGLPAEDMRMVIVSKA